MYVNYVRQNKTMVAVVLFLIIFGFIQLMKPSCLYNKDGSVREFGIGYRNKTILPIWLLSICLGILCYLAVIYYTTYHSKMAIFHNF
jgi:hypothetical protein